MTSTVDKTVNSDIPTKENNQTETPPLTTTSKIKRVGTIETSRYIVQISAIAVGNSISAPKKRSSKKNIPLKIIYLSMDNPATLSFKLVGKSPMILKIFARERPLINHSFSFRKYPIIIRDTMPAPSAKRDFEEYIISNFPRK